MTKVFRISCFSNQKLMQKSQCARIHRNRISKAHHLLKKVRVFLAKIRQTRMNLDPPSRTVAGLPYFSGRKRQVSEPESSEFTAGFSSLIPGKLHLGMCVSTFPTQPSDESYGRTFFGSSSASRKVNPSEESRAPSSSTPPPTSIPTTRLSASFSSYALW